MNTPDLPDEPLAGDSGPQCKDCLRFFPGVQLIPLAHGDVCHDCHQQRQDTVMPAEAFDKTTPPSTGLAGHLWDMGVAMSRVHRDELQAQERIRENQT